jgi:hypothetical protein
MQAEDQASDYRGYTGDFHDHADEFQVSVRCGGRCRRH